MCSEQPADFLEILRRSDHPDFEAGYDELAFQGLELAANETGREGLDPEDGLRILNRDRREDGGPAEAESPEYGRIEQDTRASGGIESGDGDEIHDSPSLPSPDVFVNRNPAERGRPLDDAAPRVRKNIGGLAIFSFLRYLYSGRDMSKVVVQFLDGKSKRGSIPFFNPAKQTVPFETTSEDGKSNIQMTVHIEEIKKILFLKKASTEDSAVRKETISQTHFAGTVAYKLVVEMNDGEVLTGTTLKYSPGEKSFFLMPLNPADQSERIYINTRCVTKVDQKRLLGRMLVDAKIIDGSQLQNALNLQAEHRKKMIGQILLEQELISRQQLDESLNTQKNSRSMLGEILVEAQYISRDQLDKALIIQKENRKKRLGQILVELKYVTPDDICLALASQMGCAWVDLSVMTIPEDVLRLLPREVVLKYEVIPVEKKFGELLIVASAQPRDEEMRSVVSAQTPMRTEFVVAYDGYILEALAKYYRAS
ncbi:MAG: hypothetical protein NTW38_02645 [Candidatus Aminicenantes bacterium]|nr:hypothetical protein [Candidatus Aminicenantes bacterium]